MKHNIGTTYDIVFSVFFYLHFYIFICMPNFIILFLILKITYDFNHLRFIVTYNLPDNTYARLT